MSIQLSRRRILHLAGAGAFLHSHVRRTNSQEPTPALQLPPVPIVPAMGIDPKWIGYLQYCDRVGLGNYDIFKIDVRGEAIAAVKKTYRLHTGVERHLRWMGPLVEDADA